jgi:hypothetical protein
MFIITTPNNKVTLSVQLTDGVTTLYPKAFIYDIDGNLITTVNLTHVANGLYIEEYTPNGTYKQLIVNYVVYSDTSRITASDDYGIGADTLYVDTFISRILGLSQENYRIFSPVYNANKDMTSCTIKIYSSATDCDNDTNSLATYLVTSEYDGGNKMTSYKVTKQ